MWEYINLHHSHGCPGGGSPPRCLVDQTLSHPRNKVSRMKQSLMDQTLSEPQNKVRGRQHCWPHRGMFGLWDNVLFIGLHLPGLDIPEHLTRHAPRIAGLNDLMESEVHVLCPARRQPQNQAGFIEHNPEAG